MKNLTRREFIKLTNRFLAVTGLGVVMGPVLAYFFPAKLEETPSEPILVGTESELPPGSSRTIRFGRYPALVIHTSQGVKAYSAVCTHFACICKYDPQSDKIACPCHEGYFDPLDGQVLAGPPPTPLKAIGVRIDSGQIYLDSSIIVGGVQ